MPPETPQTRVIITADDFGLSQGVNEAIEQAHRDGILGTASLMVAGPAADDAVERARRLPGLHVGLHLVVIEGPAVLPPQALSRIAPDGRFASDQGRRGIRYAFDPVARRQLRAEIAAQYAAFAATGLRLDHANAHKHMHLHPTVGRMLIEEGRIHGLRAIRVPAEPPAILEAAGETVGAGARALFHWTKILRGQARRAGLRTNDACFGLAWSGGMTAARLLRLAPLLPPGVNEVYFHPATRTDALTARLMPDYQPMVELAALLDPDVAAALPKRTTY